MNEQDFTLNVSPSSSQAPRRSSLGSLALSCNNASQRSAKTAVDECQAACINYLQVIWSIDRPYSCLLVLIFVSPADSQELVRIGISLSTIGICP